MNIIKLTKFTSKGPATRSILIEIFEFIHIIHIILTIDGSRVNAARSIFSAPVFTHSKWCLRKKD